MEHQTDDLRITSTQTLREPDELIGLVPVTKEVGDVVVQARKDVSAMLRGEDDRVAVVVGPCSIHDPDAALEYAQKLAVLKQQYSNELCIIMRVYFEKPRTTVGWKGLINDPDMDNSFNINKGLQLARTVLFDINAMGLPAGVEYLDLISPQYIADLVGWGAIGARTTESQGHRELASGLSCPVGFKNGTAGSVQIAVDAIGAATQPHNFLSVSKNGHSSIFTTAGNPDCHVILRGGKANVNYDAASVDSACALLEKAKLPQRVMIDCSHANSRKMHERQKYVCRDICSQIADGDQRIMGVMIESNLVAGNQSPSAKPLTRGQSVTDACLAWDDTVPLLEGLAKAVVARRQA